MSPRQSAFELLEGNRRMRFDLVDLRLFLHIADASRMVQEGPTSRLLPRASASGAWRKCSALHFSFVTAAEFSYHLLANVSWSTRVSSCSKRSACGAISPATPGGCRAQSACYPIRQPSASTCATSMRPRSATRRPATMKKSRRGILHLHCAGFQGLVGVCVKRRITSPLADTLRRGLGRALVSTCQNYFRTSLGRVNA